MCGHKGFSKKNWDIYGNKYMRLFEVISKLFLSHNKATTFEPVMCILYNNLKGYIKFSNENLEICGKEYMRLF